MPLSDGPITAEPYVDKHSAEEKAKRDAEAKRKAAASGSGEQKRGLLDRIKSMLGMGGDKDSSERSRVSTSTASTSAPMRSTITTIRQDTSATAVRATGSSYLPPSTSAARTSSSYQPPQPLGDSVVTRVGSTRVASSGAAPVQPAHSSAQSGLQSLGGANVPLELHDVLSRLHRELYGSPIGEVAGVINAQALLNRMRQEIGMPLTGDPSADGVLRVARETAQAVGC